MKRQQKIENRISLILFIILIIFIWFLSAPEEVKTEQIDNKLEEKQETTADAEMRIYNEIMDIGNYKERISKEYIYSKESGFAYNNIYLPTKETNPYSGKKGICQLHTKDGKDLKQQDKDCTNYMEHRYGTWEAAQAFWVENGWW